MDKKKHNKEEKVDADGLTKKERRALKVQAKQTDDNKAELKINQKNKMQEPSKEVPLAPKVEEITKEVGKVTLNTPEKTDTLSEKQKRKLEWEKKRAEQGNLANKTETNQGLSKAELKAKRREIQEAQRLAKSKPDVVKIINASITKNVEEDKKIKENQPAAKGEPCTNVENPSTKDCNSGNFFNHLLASSSFKPIEEVYPVVCTDVHPAFINFGILYATGALNCSNEKTVQFLSAIEVLVKDLRVPAGEEFCRYLETVLDNCVDFLQERKNVSFSMLNSLKTFKVFLTQLGKNLSDDDKKDVISEYIDTYINEQIITAGKAISLKVQEKISDGDVILVYGWSNAIFDMLEATYKEHNKKFSLVIVDGRPSFEGEQMLKKISDFGIRHTYVMIHSLSHVIQSVTKVLLEADALLTNGYLLAKAGTAQIAMMAKVYSRPVLVCCETYKFTERVQTDGLMCNELGHPDMLLKNIMDQISPKKEEKNNQTLFNLLYDITPSDLVTAVLTELAMLPCSSVPVVLRIKPQER